MKRFVLAAACCVAIAGCASDPARTPPAPRPVPDAPSAPASPPATVSAQDAAAICKITASTKFGVGLPDVAVSGTKKVDAGWLTKVTIGNVEKNCVVTPDGSIRSLQ